MQYVRANANEVYLYTMYTYFKLNDMAPMQT